MPPIPQQQTSRAGLITSLVVAILFAVGFLVGWVMTNADLQKKDIEVKAQLAKYKEVIDAGVLSNVATYKGEFSPDPSQTRGGTLVDMAAEQRKALIKLITGAPEGTEKATAEAVAAAYDKVKKNPDLAGANVPDTSLIAALDAISSQVSARAADAKKAKDEAKASADMLAAAVEAHKAEIAKRDQAVADAQAAQKKSEDEAKVAIAEKQKQVDDFSTKIAATEKAMGDLQAVIQVEKQTLTTQIDKLKKDLSARENKLAQFRPDVKESIVRNVDATVTQVAPDSICYINLGYGDHVVTGMTFELYEKTDGVPRLNPGQSALDMTKGKASIEIISVGQNSSQCRVLRVSTGQTVSQGDLCVNIVYDKHIKPTFFVYGKYDMDGNGVATDGEAEIIKNLITRWGGRIAEKVDIDTDFVVMGKEPVVPLYTPEELESPINKAKKDEADAALKAYNDVRDSAVSIHIPVLNQNRFLYYTGYFDSSKK
jgi:hypothetical protein